MKPARGSTMNWLVGCRARAPADGGPGMTAHLHETGTGEDGVNTLQAWRTGIDTHQEPVVCYAARLPCLPVGGFHDPGARAIDGRRLKHRGDAQCRRR